VDGCDHRDHRLGFASSLGSSGPAQQAWGPAPKISISDEQHCYEFFETNPDLAVQFCSAAIRSGRLSKANLAITFNNRGNASSKKNDYDGAIRDYSEAIHLNHAVQVRRTPAGVH
jgi:hypothetical protein